MITSTRHPLIKAARKLRNKKFRLEEGSFYIEGVRVFLSAVEAGAPIQTVFYSPGLLTSDLVLDKMPQLWNAGVNCQEVSAEVFRWLSSRDNPVGIGAVVSADYSLLEELEVKQDSIFTAIMNVAEPGNLGTIIRTIDAVGGDGLILVGAGVDPFHPTAVKASMGTLFYVAVSQVADAENLLKWSAERGIKVVATSAHASLSLWDVELQTPALVLLGSEGEGLPDEILERANLTVSLPMAGSASSLNLAVAAGVVLYEFARKKQRSGA